MIRAKFKMHGHEYFGTCMGMCKASDVGVLVAILVDESSYITWVPEAAKGLDQVRGFSELSFFSQKPLD